MSSSSESSGELRARGDILSAAFVVFTSFTLGVALLHCGVTDNDAPGTAATTQPATAADPKRPAKRSAKRSARAPTLGLSAQLFEIVQVRPRVEHVTTLFVPSFTLSGPIASRWLMVGVVGVSTGIDAASLGGSLALAFDGALVDRRGWRLGLGPEFAFIQSTTRLPRRWQWASIFTAGAGLSITRGRLVLGTGLAASMSPQFGTSLNLLPRFSIAALF